MESTAYHADTISSVILKQYQHLMGRQRVLRCAYLC